jgi:hypothetical protein
MRVEVDAPKGALVHIYRDGQLVRSVTPEEAKALTIPANGAAPEDIQIVVVTRTGEVLSTPAPEPAGAGGGDKPASTGPGSTTGGSSAAPSATPSAGAKRQAASGAGTKQGTKQDTGTNNNGKSGGGKAGQRSSNDTTKSGK